MSNDYLKLPFQYSEGLLFRDLEICQKFRFTDHYNTSDFTGKWTSIALRSSSGDYKEIFATELNPENYKDTQLMKRCTYFQKIVDSFKCKKLSVRLLNLLPGSSIKEHCDHNLSYTDGEFRIHIPITTNPNVSFYINSINVTMLPGECWYGDFTLPHSVKNEGMTDRAHLVIDCIRNPWTDDLFIKSGYDLTLEKSVEYDKNTKLKMIQELERIHTPASLDLIKKFKAEIKNAE